MRDSSLNILFSSVTHIKGVGEGTAQALSRLLPAATALSGRSLPIIRDLLFHLPLNIVDRRFTCSLSQAPDNVVATFIVRVITHLPPPPVFRRGGKKPYKVICSNDTGDLTLVFFHASDEYIKQTLPIGAERVVSGRTEHFEFRLQMTHPDIIAPLEKLAEVQKPEAVYPLTLGLSSRRIAKIVDTALEKLPDLPEWIDTLTIERYHWPSWKTALTKVHHPESPEDISLLSLERQRLAYDEILANQLYLTILRRAMQRQVGEIITGDNTLVKLLRGMLPFALTGGQEQVLQEIYDDMASGKRMGRLLQGDVGSGKTIVALLSMARVAEQGLQSALMVPTEIIAGQHYDTLKKLTSGLGIEIGLLTGSVKGKARQEVLAGIASGAIHIIVGTHALFQDQVEFHRLALAVIDEQHRFGVGQRMALTAKGKAPHLLHMTATPIPRSLTMTLYGDMECSSLKEKPAERQPITTRTVALSRYETMMERLHAALDRGEKAYWICPLIEATEDTADFTLETDIAAAETRFTEFKTRFGPQVGMVHGRMKAEARTAEMQRFASGDTRLLVATTVVEVGVDVRDATIIVIEKAERFGLSQLHQLRGRVGRGDKPSFCVLLYSDKSGDIARERLLILRDSEDGFRIAEADLAIRGGGDLLGTRQSGLPRFVFTDPAFHQELLDAAREDATNHLETDTSLKSERGKRLQLLLQLFGYAHDNRSQDAI